MTSTFRRLGSRRSSYKPLEVGEPDLDERPYRILETGLASQRKRLFVASAHLLRLDALFQPVVAGHEQLLDACPRIGLHLERLSWPE
jgi:hypothetical protein